jgi:hypothetical protein
MTPMTRIGKLIRSLKIRVIRLIRVKFPKALRMMRFLKNLLEKKGRSPKVPPFFVFEMPAAETAGQS